MLKTQVIRGAAAVALLAAAIGLAACGDDEPANGSAEEQGSTLPTGSEPEVQPFVSVDPPVPEQCAAWPMNTSVPSVKMKLAVH